MGDVDPSPVPQAILDRLGEFPRDLSRFGSSRVLTGNEVVLKVGPPDRTAREAFVLTHVAASGLLRVPMLLDEGHGWLLLRAVEVVPPADTAQWTASALSDLARLHESPRLPNDQRLRSITGCELPALSARCSSVAARHRLPAPLTALALDPAALLDELRGGDCLLHGDAWTGNVLSTAADGRCWIDWEEAGLGHPALDLANWLYGSPWVRAPRNPVGDLEAYLAARTTVADPEAFRRSIDAAVVLLFLLLDLPTIAGSDSRAHRNIIGLRAATARRFAN